MFIPHNYALQIEITMRSVFKCKEGGMGGIANADFIEANPFVAISLVLGNFYNKIDEGTKKKIDEFFARYYEEMGKSIKDIGEVKIKELIKEFHNITSTI